MNMTPQQHAILTELFDQADARGWQIEHVNDGEEIVPAERSRAIALDAIDSVDYSSVTFTREDRGFTVALILQNGPEIISDYGYSRDMQTEVDALMDKVQALADTFL